MKKPELVTQKEDHARGENVLIGRVLSLKQSTNSLWLLRADEVLFMSHLLWQGRKPALETNFSTELRYEVKLNKKPIKHKIPVLTYWRHMPADTFPSQKTLRTFFL